MKIITFDDTQESLQSHEIRTPMAKIIRQVGAMWISRGQGNSKNGVSTSDS